MEVSRGIPKEDCSVSEGAPELHPCFSPVVSEPNALGCLCEGLWPQLPVYLHLLLHQSSITTGLKWTGCGVMSCSEGLPSLGPHCPSQMCKFCDWFRWLPCLRFHGSFYSWALTCSKYHMSWMSSSLFLWLSSITNLSLQLMILINQVFILRVWNCEQYTLVHFIDLCCHLIFPVNSWDLNLVALHPLHCWADNHLNLLAFNMCRLLV